jgi:hypothetical protein
MDEEPMGYLSATVCVSFGAELCFLLDPLLDTKRVGR